MFLKQGTRLLIAGDVIISIVGVGDPIGFEDERVGVDVGSKDTIFRIIQRLAGNGMAVIIISDDLPELLQNYGRIALMRKGERAEIFAAGTPAKERLYGAPRGREQHA